MDINNSETKNKLKIKFVKQKEEEEEEFSNNNNIFIILYHLTKISRDMFASTNFLLIVVVAISVYRVDSHGRMEEPAARNSAWRHGFKTPANYNDLELNCGGLFHQVQQG